MSVPFLKEKKVQVKYKQFRQGKRCGLVDWWCVVLRDGRIDDKHQLGDGVTRIRKQTMRTAYHRWLADQSESYPTINEIQFSIILKRVLPWVSNYQGNESGDRFWSFELPTLGECKRFMPKHLLEPEPFVYEDELLG